MTTFTVNLSEKELETILDALLTTLEVHENDKDSSLENEKDCQEVIHKLQAIRAINTMVT